MGYEAELIAEGKCPEVVWIPTEDGPVTGRCMGPIVEVQVPPSKMHGETEPSVVAFACEGHSQQIIGWRNQTEAETIAWEQEQYDERPGGWF